MIAFHLGCGASFAQEAAPGGSAGTERRQESLQRDAPFEVEIFRLEDNAHAAGADDAQDAVVAQPSQFIGRLGRGEARTEIGGVVGRFTGRRSGFEIRRDGSSRRREGRVLPRATTTLRGGNVRPSSAGTGSASPHFAQTAGLPRPP